MVTAVPDVANRLTARQNASVIADVTSGRVTSSRQVVVGEPDCPYQVRLNFDDFWFGVRVSESAYVATGNHKRRFDTSLPFYASLKTKNAAMLTNLHLPSVSEHLGVKVFVSSPALGPPAAAALRSSECAPILAKIDFGAVRSMFLSPVQISVVSDLVDPHEAAAQVLLLRSLLLASWRWKERTT